MERKRDHLDELERLIDTTLAAEDMVLDSLKKALDRGTITQLQFDEDIAAFHWGLTGEVPACSPEDINGSRTAT